MSKPQHHSLFTADARFALVQPTSEGGAIVLAGYALVWNATSSDRGGYVVRFLKDSATFTPTVRALWDHNSRDILGRTDNNTLRVLSDDTGVRVEIELPNTTAGRDVAEYVRRRDIRGMSFGVADWPPAGATTQENGQAVLSVTRCLIDEVTVTANPAFEASSIDVKREQQHAARRADGRRFMQARNDFFTLPPRF